MYQYQSCEPHLVHLVPASLVGLKITEKKIIKLTMLRSALLICVDNAKKPWPD